MPHLVLLCGVIDLLSSILSQHYHFYSDCSPRGFEFDAETILLHLIITAFVVSNSGQVRVYGLGLYHRGERSLCVPLLYLAEVGIRSSGFNSCCCCSDAGNFVSTILTSLQGMANVRSIYCRSRRSSNPKP